MKPLLEHVGTGNPGPESPLRAKYLKLTKMKAEADEYLEALKTAARALNRQFTNQRWNDAAALALNWARKEEQLKRWKRRNLKRPPKT